MLTEEQVKTYCQKKGEEKVLKEAITSLGEAIKNELVNNKETDAKFGKYSVHLETRTTESIDENKLLDVLETDWVKHNGEDSELPPYIKVTRYVDMDALESAIYKGEIPQETILELDKCRIKKESTALTYKVTKEK